MVTLWLAQMLVVKYEIQSQRKVVRMTE